MKSKRKDENHFKNKVFYNINKITFKPFDLIEYNRIINEFNFIGTINYGDKFYVYNNELLKDEAYYLIQPIRRRICDIIYSGFNRNSVIQYIETIINDTINLTEIIYENYLISKYSNCKEKQSHNNFYKQKLDELQINTTQNGIPGLNNLIQTYSFDDTVKEKLESLINKLIETNKKVIK